MTIHNPALLPKCRSEALTRSAQGQPCAIRCASFVPGGRCADASTVVFCHMPAPNKSMAAKSSDHWGAFGCLHCHDIADGRDRKGADYIAAHYPTAMMERLMMAVWETQSRWLAMGLMTGPDWEIGK